MSLEKLEMIKYYNKLMESESRGQKIWASEKLYEIYQEEMKKSEVELPQELMKHMEEVLEIIKDNESRLTRVTEKLLKGMEPNEQLVKVLKGELLSPAKEMSENFIPNLKHFMESLKDRNDKNIGFNNIDMSKKEDE